MLRIFLIVFLLTMECWAQNSAIDSLKRVILTSEDSKENSINYSKLAKAFGSSNSDSAMYYAKKGYELAKLGGYNLGMAENLAAIADFFILENNLEEAKNYYLESLKYFDTDIHLFDHTQITMIIGNINLAQNNFIEALELYQTCLDISREKNYESLLPHLYNNLGNLYLEIEDYDDALENYTNANRLFNETGDDYSAAVALSNIANIENVLGDSDAALSRYLDVIRIFSEDENWADIARAYNLITKIYIQQNKFGKAEEYLQLALKLLENSSYEYTGPLSIYESDIYTTAANLYFRLGKYARSKDYALGAIGISLKNSYKQNILENARFLSDIYKESRQLDSALYYNNVYIVNNEAYQNENDLKRITQLKMQYEFDEILKRREIDEIKKQAEYERKEIIYMGTLIVAILVVIISALLYLNQKSKTAKISLKKENLELEKENLNQEIEYKKKELASNMMSLVEKNEFLTKIARQLVDLKPSSKKDNQYVLQGIINELRLNSNNKIWDEFELRFKEVHSNFYDALNKAFPDLSPNEIKLCAFLRLNMSTKEISSITHQSVKSINMARFRLRKKLNMDRDENLIAFLIKL